jgi:hypothetical protein
MTLRIVVAVAVFAVAAGAAWWFERRRKPAGPARGRDIVPQQLNRADFDRPDAPWLVALFTSAHCDSCHGLLDKALPLASDEVAVVEIEFTQHRDLHRRYGIEAAPILVVADADGVTQASFIGAFDAPELWAKVAEVRDQVS